MKNMKVLKKVSVSMTLVLGLTMALGQLAFAQADSIIPEGSLTAAAEDTSYPSDVENVQAVGGDGMITLSWDPSEDNVGVEGYNIFYGTESVTSDAASYTMGPIDAGNVLTYDVEGLENGTEYFFALTAYDAADNESEYYSYEVSATPEGGTSSTTATDDASAPKVVSANADYKNSVKVVFSEAVKLPMTNPEQAFSVKDDFLGTTLAVTDAEMDATDKSNKTVLLTTANQKTSKYLLTVGIQVEDLMGNPIVSGTSDTAFFTGSDETLEVDVKPAADETADTVAPELVSVEATDANTVEVTFSEPVVLNTNAAQNFLITEVDDNTAITAVKKVVTAQNNTVITLTTDDLADKEYNLLTLKVQDVAGNQIPVQSSATTFDGVAPAVVSPADDNTDEDTVQSVVEDAASDLVAKLLKETLVNLSWKTHEDKMVDVANFVLYVSSDKGATYDDGVVLSKEMTSYDLSDLQKEMVYYFKLTTKNSAGEESEGITTYLTLPKTGPGLLLLLLGSAGAGAVATRKKKK